MGLIYTDIDLSNPRDDALSPLTVSALVDTGSITLCVPEHVAVQLDLKELERREVTTADGKHVLVPYVGPVRVKFANRSCYTGALVLGDGVLLGSIPLEDMDLVVNSRLEKVTVNPDSPNIPSAVVKQAAGLVLRSGVSLGRRSHRGRWRQRNLRGGCDSYRTCRRRGRRCRVDSRKGFRRSRCRERLRAE